MRDIQCLAYPWYCIGIFSLPTVCNIGICTVVYFGAFSPRVVVLPAYEILHATPSLSVPKPDRPQANQRRGCRTFIYLRVLRCCLVSRLISACHCTIIHCIASHFHPNKMYWRAWALKLHSYGTPSPTNHSARRVTKTLHVSHSLQMGGTSYMAERTIKSLCG